MVKDFTPFFEAVIGLKYVSRAGWIAKVGIKNPESVADHSFAMCAIGMVLSDMLALDTNRVLKMIVLHDLAESTVGDYMPGEVSTRQKRQEEQGAMKKIIGGLPTKMRANYARIWREYLQDKTKEARFVHRIDKLEMALQAARYSKDGHPSELLEQFFETAHKTIDADDGNDILKEILKSLNPIESKEN